MSSEPEGRRYRSGGVEAQERDSAAPGPDRETGVFTFLEFANVLLRHRRAVVTFPIVAALLVSGHALLSTPTYTSQAIFMPSAEGSGAGELTRMSVQLGLRVPVAVPGTRSPQFYADLIRSRRMLHAIVDGRYGLRGAGSEGPSERAASDNRLVTLVEHYEEAGPDSTAAVARAARRLDRTIDVTTQPETGVVRFSVRDEHREIAQQIAQRILELLNRFDREIWRTQAGVERRFIEERLGEAWEELLGAEAELQRFLEANRRYEGSPELTFEYDRLQRRVSLRQDVHASLLQSYEEAKIRESRDTPLIIVVDAPDEPAIPDRRWLLVRGILGLGLGGLLAVLWAFGLEGGRRVPGQEPDAHGEFERLATEAREDLGSWLIPLRSGTRRAR